MGQLLLFLIYSFTCGGLNLSRRLTRWADNSECPDLMVIAILGYLQVGSHFYDKAPGLSLDLLY